MSLNKLASTLLPATLYQRLAMSDIAKRLARGSLWSIAGTGISRVLVLVAMILVAQTLGKVSFGEFGLIQATLGVAGLMAGLGLGSTATRFVAQHAESDPGRAGYIIALLLQVSWGTALLAAGGLIFAAPYIASYVLNATHLYTVLVWGALLMVVGVIRGVQSGIIGGLEKFDLVAKLNVLEGVVSLIVMVTLTGFMGLKGALLGLILGSFVAWLVGRVILNRDLKSRGILVNYRGCWQDWRILRSCSLPSLLANLVATPVLWFCMTLVAQSPNGYAELGIYNAAYQWHGPLIFIPMIVMSVSIPVLVQEWESGRIERFRRVTLWIFGLTMVVALPLVLFISVMSPWVMSFYGPGFSEGWLVMVLLTAAAPLHAVAKIASGALLSMNRAWWILGVNSLWGGTMLVLTLLLIPTQGVNGLATAFLAAYCVLSISSVAMVLFGSRAEAIRP